MLNNIGTIELLIIAAVIFILFGGTKLPGLAKSISQASLEFRKGLKSNSESDENEKNKSGTKK